MAEEKKERLSRQEKKSYVYKSKANKLTFH